MEIVCLDLEGVLVPEIWIGVAENTGIEDLRRTTRDEPNYDRLMRYRLDILETHKLGLPDIQKTIAEMEPLPGASDFLDELRTWAQVVILSDTFYPFAKPLMRQLGWPTLFCHDLEVGNKGRILSHKLRKADPKRHAVKAFRELGFRVMAVGDSYNDTTMLEEADKGFFFRPPENITREFPHFSVVQNHKELHEMLRRGSRDKFGL